MNTETKRILEDFIATNIDSTSTTKSTNMKYTVVAKADTVHMNVIFEITATAMLSHVIAVKDKEVVTDCVLCTPISDYDFDTLDFINSPLEDLKKLLLEITYNISEDSDWDGKFNQLLLINQIKEHPLEGVNVGDTIRGLDVVITKYGTTKKVIDFLDSKGYNGTELVGSSYASSDMQDIWFTALTELKKLLQKRDLGASTEFVKKHDVKGMNKDGSI